MLILVILVMVTGFMALQLYRVLGKRTGHEQPLPKSGPKPAEDRAPLTVVQRPVDVVSEPREITGRNVEAKAEAGIRAIIGADSAFDVSRFLQGAQSAYRMILDAFWAGDAAAMAGLVSDEVLEHFRVAIAHRDGSLPHTLVSVDAAAITAARMVGQMAEVTVRFEATIATGSETAAGHDVWTFSRHIGAHDPAWLLIETDADA